MNLKELYEEIQSDYKIVLARFCNEESLLSRFVLSFPKDPTYQSLTEAVRAHDNSGIEMQAHTLKGVAGNLGFNKLQDACADVVSCVRQNNLDSIPANYEKLEQEYKLIIDKISMME